MARLLVHVEGQTEEEFVNNVLAPYLHTKGYTNVGARLLGNARTRDKRCGIKGWGSVCDEISKKLLEDSNSIQTTMVDYYALPQEGDRAWPGRKEAGILAFKNKAPLIQKNMLKDICSKMGSNFNPNRFIPYIQMHEFEALLFSNCSKFAEGLDQPQLASKFQEVRDSFNSPEEINDHPETAPSKQVQSIMRNYDKPFHGFLAASAIGLDSMKSECQNFNSWLVQLENALLHD